jgi:hypothetical protein
MIIDEHEVPNEIFQYYKSSIENLSDVSIVAAGKKLPSLIEGLNQKKPNLKIVRERINGHLDRKSIPVPIMELLREGTHSEDFFAALSLRAIKHGGEDWIAYFGTEPYLGSLLLDDRETVRDFAREEYKKINKKPKGNLHKLVDTANLIGKFSPFLQTIQLLLTGVESKTQIAPTKATPEKIQMSKEAEESLIENSTLVKRLRRELNEERSNLTESDKKLNLSIKNEKKHFSDLREKIIECNNLQQDFQQKVAKGISDALQNRLGKWINPTENLIQEQSSTKSVFQQAKAALQNQEKIDLRYKTISQLRENLKEALDLKENLTRAIDESLRISPDIHIAMKKIQIEIQNIETILNKGSIAPDSSHLIDIARKLKTSGTIEQVIELKTLITNEIANQVWPIDEGSKAFDLINQRILHFYTTNDLSSQVKVDDLNRLTPLKFLRNSLYSGTPCHILIDGHNLLHKIRALIDPIHFDTKSGPNRLARNLLIGKLRDLVESQPSINCELWFDGPEDTEWRENDNLRVLFSGGTGDNRADSRIIESLNSLAYRRIEGEIFVVSDDGGVLNKSKEFKGIGVSPVEFWIGFLGI